MRDQPSSIFMLTWVPNLLEAEARAGEGAPNQNIFGIIIDLFFIHDTWTGQEYFSVTHEN